GALVSFLISSGLIVPQLRTREFIDPRNDVIHVRPQSRAECAPILQRLAAISRSGVRENGPVLLREASKYPVCRFILREDFTGCQRCPNACQREQPIPDIVPLLDARHEKWDSVAHGPDEIGLRHRFQDGSNWLSEQWHRRTAGRLNENRNVWIGLRP